MLNGLDKLYDKRNSSKYVKLMNVGKGAGSKERVNHKKRPTSNYTIWLVSKPIWSRDWLNSSISSAVAAWIYVVWCEGRSNVCENRLGEVRIEGVGEFGLVPTLQNGANYLG